MLERLLGSHSVLSPSCRPNAPRRSRLDRQCGWSSSAVTRSVMPHNPVASLAMTLTVAWSVTWTETSAPTGVLS
jgi:hypothetical protein